MTTETDTVTVEHNAPLDAARIRDGREVARALIQEAMRVLAPYVDGCPTCTHALLTGIGFEISQNDMAGGGRIDAVVHHERPEITYADLAKHVAHARPAVTAMLERFGQTHYRLHPDSLTRQ